MGKSNIEKRSETAQFTLSEIQKIITGFIPGGHLIDSFWNYRSGLKQQRILAFSERLKVFITSEVGLSLEDCDFEREDFVDVFDSIFEEVTRTKSELKLERFRNILIRSMNGGFDTDMSRVYIDLTTSLHDIQILILELYYSKFEKELEINSSVTECHREAIRSKINYNTLLKSAEDGEIVLEVSLSEARNEQNLREFQLKEAEVRKKEFRSQFQHFHFNISRGEYDYFRRDLISKGLLNEDITDSDEDGRREWHIRISSFGKRYIHFIGFE